MKNQFKTIVTALLLGATIFANAGTIPANPTLKTYALSMYKINGESLYNVAINKTFGSLLKITLKAANNEIVYENYISKNETKFRTKLNLNYVENGKYLLIVTDGATIETKEIEVSNNIKALKTSNSFEMGIIQTAGSKSLNINIDKIEGMEVHIYLKDDTGNIVYKELLKKSAQTFRSKYNLSKLEMGNYQLVVTDGIQYEVKPIEVR